MTHVDGGGVPAGTQLNGIYEIEKRVAIGGMGEVYIGRVIQTGDRVAIKMILPEHANNELILDLFRREASTLHNLYHEAIVRYYVFSVDPVLNRPYLSMEYASGPSLGDRLQEAPLKEERLTVLRQRVAGGLHAAHKLGVIHRDISPDNIILVDGEVGKAKIIDFGIAKSTATNEGTLIGSGFAGKLKYVSPEQLGLFGGEVTGKSDMYSLGLVFAEAVIGTALPMGGSQFEVIEKRRSVPDLSGVPEWIRPLIEAMIQPDPADRPADMQAVAGWAPAAPAAKSRRGAAAAAAAPRTPTHPRERRRQAGTDEERKGAPWLWIGLGGAGLAAAAAAAFLLIGGEPDGPGGTTGGGTLAPGATATLVAPAASVAAPSATAGASYAWTSRPFQFDGDPAALAFSAAGALPPGMVVTGEGSAARLSGTPSRAGDYTFAVVAAAPSGETARMDVSLAVADQLAAVAPLAPTTPSGGLTPPTGGDSGAPALGGGDSGISLAPAGTPGLAPATGAGAPPVLPPADSDPTAGSAEPSVATGVPGGLSAPSDAGASGGLVPGGSDAAPAPGQSPGLSLTPAPGAAGLPAVPPVDRDPTAGSAEPTVATGVPGGLSAPSDAGASGGLVPGGSDAAPAPGQSPGLSLTPAPGAGALPTVPPVDRDPTAGSAEPSVATGVPGGLSAPAIDGGIETLGSSSGAGGTPVPVPRIGQPQQPAGAGGAGNDPVIAAVPSPENLPPTVESASPGPLAVGQGQAVNARLGSFFDEEGPSALSLRVDGTVPNGLVVRLAEGGIAQLYGTPAEFGDYEIRVAAVDPQGLVSQPIAVSLSIAPPVENATVRDYILGYKGGDCFLSRPLKLGPQLAHIEVFAAQDKVQPVIEFDAAFKRDIGFEANIGMRPISAEQCPLIHALDQVGQQALDNSLVIDLDRDELSSGDRLAGKIRGGEGASLFLYDHLGGLTDLTQYVETKSGETGFSVPVTASGPQILIAARPREGATVETSSGLEAMLGAAQREQASLALGFFIMK